MAGKGKQLFPGTDIDQEQGCVGSQDRTVHDGESAGYPSEVGITECDEDGERCVREREHGGAIAENEEEDGLGQLFVFE